MPPDPTQFALIEGARPVMEALRAGRRKVHRVVLPEGDGSASRRELQAPLAEHGIRPQRAKAGRGPRLADPYLGKTWRC
jgi:hypothetical protein